MGVYIKGMEMPFVGSVKTIAIYPDGTVRTRRQDPLPYTAVPVHPHGRLIDADKLKAKQQEDADLFINAVSLAEKSRRDEALNAVANIVNAPTIIPASFENPTKNARYSQDNPAEEGE